MTFRLVVAVAILGNLTSVLHAAERVSFVIGPNSSDIEKMAADESATQFKKLFGVEAVLVTELSRDAQNVVLIGSPDTNPAMKSALGGKWPKVSEQGIVIKSVDINGKPALVIGGGSSAATFWAVAEFGYRNGVRYLIHDDVYPAETIPLKLGGHDIVMEPALKIRTWRAIGESALSPVSWSLNDQKRLILQLAKMKFNQLQFQVSSSQPLTDLKTSGDGNPSLSFFKGSGFRVDGDTPGKVAFRGAKIFENPDFAGKQKPEEMAAAGIAYFNGLIQAATDFGMSTDISMNELPAQGASATATSSKGVSQDASWLGGTDGESASKSGAQFKKLLLVSSAAGILPQSSQTRLAADVQSILDGKLTGFSTGYFIPGDLDPALNYLSRASFDPKITARDAHNELFTATTGKQSVSDRLWQAFSEMEKATELIEKNDPGFAYPSPDMITRHMKAEPAPSWWMDVTAHYVNASGEFYRAHDAADPRSRKLLFYFAKRSEYVLEYLAAVDAARASAIAKKAGKLDEAAEKLDSAVEQMYNALDTLSDIARDQSDRALIAVLAEYAYRPLVKEVEKLANEEPEPAPKKE
ncbi:MAG: hypothetical protein AB7O26_16515 [Planctomycetaceae bacterium]